MIRKELVALAQQHDWQEIKDVKDPHMISFSKIIGGSPARINIWNDKMTVGTYLKHPKQGKTQLFRRLVTPKEMDLIFKNPRHHTQKGYR